MHFSVSRAEISRRRIRFIGERCVGSEPPTVVAVEKDGVVCRAIHYKGRMSSHGHHYPKRHFETYPQGKRGSKERNLFDSIRERTSRLVQTPSQWQTPLQ